jgi:hypothetical protein
MTEYLAEFDKLEIEMTEEQKRVEGFTQPIIILACLGYPLVFEFIQVIKFGFINYFSDLANYMDVVFIGGSVVMALIRFWGQSKMWYGKLVTILVIMACIRRTFSFMRIF